MARLLPLLVCFLFLNGCGDDASPADASMSDDAGGGRDANTPPLDCTTTCIAKFTECMAPGDPAAACAMVCPLSDANVLCLSNASCTALAMANDFTDLCPAGTDAGPGRDAGPGTDVGPGTDSGPGGCSLADPPRCEGDVRIACEELGGFPATVRTTCSAGCAGGECVGPPETLRIEGRFGRGVEPTTILSSDMRELITSLSIGAEPDFSVELPDQFDLRAAGVTVAYESPDPSGCTHSPSVTVNSSQVALNIVGTDVLPDSSCSNFVSDIVDDGVTLVYSNVPYLNLSGTLTITIALRP